MKNFSVSGSFAAIGDWLNVNIVSLGREMRLSYMPPLMVYVAAGISGLTNIVGTFYVKEKLGLSAEFLAMLGFWMMLPWALKMPLGHLVDLMWRWKSLLVYLGASLIMLSLVIMIGLLGNTEFMMEMASVETWYVVSVLLAPIGYVLQDVVADAMTGQDAINIAARFNELLDIDGVILTKLDGDARGGAAFSIKAVTGKPIKFVGLGEKPTPWNPFTPTGWYPVFWAWAISFRWLKRPKRRSMKKRPGNLKKNCVRMPLLWKISRISSNKSVRWAH